MYFKLKNCANAYFNFVDFKPDASTVVRYFVENFPDATSDLISTKRNHPHSLCLHAKHLLKPVFVMQNLDGGEVFLFWISHQRALQPSRRRVKARYMRCKFVRVSKHVTLNYAYKKNTFTCCGRAWKVFTALCSARSTVPRTPSIEAACDDGAILLL